MHRIVHFASLENSCFVKPIAASSTFISWIERIKTFYCMLIQKRLHQFARLPAIQLSMDLIHLQCFRAIGTLASQVTGFTAANDLENNYYRAI